MEFLPKQLSEEKGIDLKKVKSVIKLVKEDGNTVPFVARYRKMETGNLAEDEIRGIVDRWDYLKNLEERKKEIIETLKKREKLTPALEKSIKEAVTQQELEEIYGPYKQKKKTRGMKARERGLLPLAELFKKGEFNTEEEAFRAFSAYVDPEKGLASEEEVLQGVKDIIAEEVSQEVHHRRRAKSTCQKSTYISTEAKEKEKDEKGTYRDYYEFKGKLLELPSHRMMAITRGEREGILKVDFISPEEEIIDNVTSKEFKELVNGYSKQLLEDGAADGCKRLLIPSIERELKKLKLEEAEERAIEIFVKNLERLLMQPPIKGKVILGVDPAYKTGCKLAVVEKTGDLKEVDVIYPTPPRNEVEKSREKVKELINNHGIEIIAIGNGTGSRETEEFIANTISSLKENSLPDENENEGVIKSQGKGADGEYSKNNSLEIKYAIVSEDGASVYSASEVAAAEFPDLDVQERSAVSIARRVLDPLSELVKINPKSLGVGQYQHDVSQKKLQEAVDFVVEKVVNQVGVDINTASVYLLRYVSGLNKNTAIKIVQRRKELEGFNSRREIKTAKGVGEKTFQQCAGFLRVLDGDNPLDKTAIHPESYHLAMQLLNYLDLHVEEIGAEAVNEKIKSLTGDPKKEKELSGYLGTDEYTLKDILTAFKKPLYDPRSEFEKPRLRKEVLKLEDLKEGMVLEGEVKNVVDFGAFVDLGIKVDGLIHISKLKEGFVKHPLDEIKVGEVVKVEILEVDKERERISLKRLV